MDNEKHIICDMHAQDFIEQLYKIINEFNIHLAKANGKMYEIYIDVVETDE